MTKPDVLGEAGGGRWGPLELLGDRFGVLILSHGRPDKVETYATLRRQGYTGRIYVVIDNEDETGDGYRERFGDQVIVFDKAEAAIGTDKGSNWPGRRGVVYARNTCWQIAESLGLDWFLVLDDDYPVFCHKFDRELVYKEQNIVDLDRSFAIMVEYLRAVPDMASLAMAQNGDFIGGSRGGMAAKVWAKRKAMNTFICATDRPFEFYGAMNEDVTAYVLNGLRGALYLTVASVAIRQKQTQSRSGGLTEIYLDQGTYVKSFYTVMYAPGCVVIGQVGDKHPRIHHRISWRATAPRILREGVRRV